jgi:hypothetical protein
MSRIKISELPQRDIPNVWGGLYSGKVFEETKEEEKEEVPDERTEFVNPWGHNPLPGIGPLTFGIDILADGTIINPKWGAK